MTRTRYRIRETEYPYFLTCTIVGWLPVFTRPEAVEIVLHWRYSSARNCAGQPGLVEVVTDWR